MNRQARPRAGRSWPIASSARSRRPNRFCRRNDLADARSRFRIEEDGLTYGPKPEMTELLAVAVPRWWAYRVENSRSGECAIRHVSGYRGTLQAEGYVAYNKLARPDRGNHASTLAGCWSHSRRKFYELHVAGISEVAATTVERMAELWPVENIVCQSPTHPLPRVSRPPRRSSRRSLGSLAADLTADLRKIKSGPRGSAMPSHAEASPNASPPTAAASALELPVRAFGPDDMPIGMP